MCLWPRLKIRFGESISCDFVLNGFYCSPILALKVWHSKAQLVELVGVVEVSDGKHKGDVEEEVAPACLSSFGKQVVEELDQVEDEGHHNPDKGQRRPVWMVGNAKEIQEKRTDIRPHIKKGKDSVEGYKLQDGQHFAGFFLLLYEDLCSKLV